MSAMRKSYIQPTLTVVHIAQVQMIAASDTGLKKGGTADGSESLVKSFNSNSGIWDDDDYKDE